MKFSEYKGEETDKKDIRVSPLNGYHLMKCCSKPRITTTRDGNRSQSCSNCGMVMKDGVMTKVSETPIIEFYPLMECGAKMTDGVVVKSQSNFKVYDYMKCCSKPSLITTNDGNKYQSCINCGAKMNDEVQLK